RAGEGRSGGDVPPAPRRGLAAAAGAGGRRSEGEAPARGRLDVPHDGRVVRAAGPPQAAQRPARVSPEGDDERSAPADVDGRDRAAVRVDRHQGARALRRGARRVRAGLPVPLRVRPGGEALVVRRGRDLVGSGVRALEGARSHERALRRGGAPEPRRADAAAGGGVKPEPDTAALWAALREVNDPEFPISVVDLGLVYGIRRAGSRVEVDLTFTATACPCM